MTSGSAGYTGSSVSKKASLGKDGEDLAARLLEDDGYEIVARNWRAGRTGEIDIVARRSDPESGRDVLVFVEVKTRASVRYGTPAESLTPEKQAKLLALAEKYLAENPANTDIRFDVVSILLDGRSSAPEVQHLQNAFDAS